ncbi:MAG: hypothetical protein ACYTBJ_20740 [Planctomycetota bacterium]|jgi:hypothetical protein
MKMRKSTKSEWWVVIILDMLLVANARSESGAPLPSLDTLVEKAVTREELFDDIDTTFTIDIYNPERDTPASKRSCRWVKHGNKAFIDFQSKDYLTPEREMFRHIKMSYNGETARSLLAHTMTGQIFRDWKKYVKKGHYEGPDVMGLTLPMLPGQKVTSFLKGTPLLSPAQLTRYKRSVQIVGRAQMDGVPCIVVDVTTGNSPAQQELVRLHLAEEYDYAVRSVEFSFVKDGVPSLSSRIRMDKFREIRKGFWYPTEARYEILHGQETPKQTTIYKLADISWPDRFEDSLFALEFPPGTYVYDTIVGISYTAGGETVHADGSEPFKLDPRDSSFWEDRTVNNGKKKETVSADADMPRIPVAATTAPNSPHGGGGEIAASSSSSFLYKVIMVTGAALLVVLIVGTLARRHRGSLSN